MPSDSGASFTVTDALDGTELRRASFVALGAAILAATMTPGHPAGLNVVLVTVLTSIAVLIGGGWQLGLFGLTAGAVALLLMTNFVVRTAEWVLALDALAALVLGVVAVTRPETWREVTRAGMEALGRLPAGLGLTARPVTGAVRVAPGRALLIGRGVLVGLALTFVFGALLVSADQAFASIARDAVLPRLDLMLLPARVIVGLVVAAATGALVLLVRHPLSDRGVWVAFGSAPAPRRKLHAIEWLPGIIFPAVSL